MYEETSGTNPDEIYGTSSVKRYSIWGFSWGNSWGLSWGSFPIPYLNSSSGTNPDDIYESNSGSGPSLFAETSGTNPDDIYEEN